MGKEPFLLDPLHRPVLEGYRDGLSAWPGRLLWLTIPLAILCGYWGILLPEQAYRQMQVDRQIAAKPVEIVAEVVLAVPQPARFWLTAYRVTYRFKAGQRGFSRPAQVDRDAYQAAARSGVINIVYLADQPGLSRAQGELRLNPGLTAAQAGLALVLPLLLGLALEHQQGRRRRLIKEGVLLDGSLCQAALDKGCLKLSYQVTSPGGAVLQGRAGARRADLVDPPPPGTPLAVLYQSDSNHLLL